MIWSAEEFESSPKTLLRHSVRWLGLDENRVNEAAVHGKHHSRQYIASILPETKRLLQDFFRPHNQRLFTFLEAKGYYDTAKTLRIQFDKI
jgi:hypothetical protein